MKKLILNSLFFFGFLLILSTNLSAQNLQFNQAIFNTYGPGNADGNQSTPMFTGSLVVGANQVLKITSSTCSSLNAIMGGTNIGPYIGYLLINDIYQLLGNQSELWLPAGIYSINGIEFGGGVNGVFKGALSGILYDIVP
jgi:hypothetical protein